MDRELLHHARAVRLGGLHADAERRRDLLGRVAFRDQLEHLAFAVGERVGGEFRLGHVRIDDGFGNARAQVNGAAQHFTDRREEVGRRLRFQYVAANARAQRFEHVGIVLVHREQHHLGARRALVDVARGLDTVQRRHAEVIEAGGLYIVGTERHESRRIDNQLRGRAGRQGDPGVSRFYLSLEDNLMRIFASDRVRKIMSALGMEKGEAIEHRIVSNAIETAQRKVEARNFDYRKQVLEYDDVANDQRQVIYHQRNELLDEDNIEDAINGIRADVIDAVVAGFIPPRSLDEQWDIEGLENTLQQDFGVKLPIQQWLDEDKKLYEEPLKEKIANAMHDVYKAKSERIGPTMRALEKQVMLHVLDQLWKEHLLNMDHLRQGIGLRAYAQRNPKQEYKRESFEMFEKLLDNLKHEVTRVLFRVEPMTQEQMEEMQRRQRAAAEAAHRLHEKLNQLEAQQAQSDRGETYVRETAKVGRNEPCPCGSGKKFKACHGKLS